MVDEGLGRKLAEQAAIIQTLQKELVQTNSGLVALGLELEARIDERSAELRKAHAELQRTNTELLQLTEELEDRVAERTSEVQRLNSELEQRVAERTAQLVAANEELKAFSYSVAHDLRAPLRALDGFSLALVEDYGPALDEQAKNYLQRIREASTRMAQLIDDLLNLAQISRAEVRREKVDLSTMAMKVMAELQNSEPEHPTQIVIAQGLEARGDPHLLGIVLENLLDNAWKFRAATRQARIEFGVAEQDGHKAYFVRDNGVGFDGAHAGRLFEPFRRLHPKTDFPGTGIGLATVARIVRKHGGEVWAEGKVDEGATFYFTLEGS